ELPKINITLSIDFLQEKWLSDKLSSAKKLESLKKVSSYVMQSDLDVLWHLLLVEYLESSKQGTLKSIKSALSLVCELYPLMPHDSWKQDREIISLAY